MGEDYLKIKDSNKFVTSHFCSAQNWRYAAKQFVKAYPSEVLVHCELYVLRFSSRLSFSF